MTFITFRYNFVSEWTILGEIRLAIWGHVAAQITIIAPKTGNYRFMPCRPELMSLLATMPRGADTAPIFPAWTSDTYKKRFARCVAGLAEFAQEGKKWHLLRSTFAVEFAAHGGAGGGAASIWELMQVLGHTNPNTSMMYANLARASGL